jgi:hypothetical protein
MNNRGLVKLALAGLLVATTSVVAAPAASAEGERNFNWDLNVDATGCEYDFQDQAWCGPTLDIDSGLFIYDDDRYSATMRLIGIDGDIPLQYGANARYSSGAFKKRTPTGGLAPGRYGVTLSYDVSGRWSCSIYSRDVCNFLNPKTGVYAWVFDWTGTSLKVPTVKMVRDATTTVIGRSSKKPLVMLNASVQPGEEGIPVTIQRQKSNGKWKTIAKKRSEVLGFVTYTDKKPPKARKVRYRLLVPDAPDFALTVTARTK